MPYTIERSPSSSVSSGVGLLPIGGGAGMIVLLIAVGGAV